MVGNRWEDVEEYPLMEAEETLSAGDVRQQILLALRRTARERTRRVKRIDRILCFSWTLAILALLFGALCFIVLAVSQT